VLAPPQVVVLPAVRWALRAEVFGACGRGSPPRGELREHETRRAADVALWMLLVRDSAGERGGRWIRCLEIRWDVVLSAMHGRAVLAVGVCSARRA
jgi:hypothetical protein